MKKIIPAYLFTFAAILSCTQEKVYITDNTLCENTDGPYEDIVEGCIRIQMKSAPSDLHEVKEILNGISIKSIVPTFPDDPRFTARHHIAGLDRWFDIFFSRDSLATKLATELSHSDKIRSIEHVHRITACSLPFNDPLLSQQWHYQNDGSIPGSVSGCDINLFKAWGVTTGNIDVIVAILDHGVMFNHEDLIDNMWTNEAELNGVAGIDDDGNGYIDDIYGYNFVANSSNGLMKGKITPGDHGTHVAGTIAATNNNGKGICGIAGGTPAKHGSSIMCCQMMDTSNDGAYSGAAFVYAADNGAVIAQNSWSLSNAESIPESLQIAIDYFVDYAGKDAYGNQTGPMSGGVVIFAAGNESSNHCVPAEYENVIAVGALAGDFSKAYYSNFGSWVDISAPGGDSNKGHYIWSTVLDNNYLGNGWQGTSMACPHVSGVAALIVAKYGKKGFSNEMLKQILLSNANERMFDYYPSLKGKMGTGLVDAYKCLQISGPEPPGIIKDIQTMAQGNNITLKWRVPSDPDDGKASFFDIYYDTEDISAISSSSYPQNVIIERISAAGKEEGDIIEHTINNLNFTTTYYIRINALDSGAHESGLSSQATIITGVNTPPVISPLGETSVSIKTFEKDTLYFKISDADGHKVSCKIDAGRAVTLKQDNDIAMMVFTGSAEPSGTHQSVLTAQDEYGAFSVLTVNYSILPNSAPVVITQPDNLVFNKTGVSKSLNADEYIKDPDGELLKYSVSVQSQNKLIVSSYVEGQTIIIRSKSTGYADVTITGEDTIGASASVSFKVLVRDGNQEIEIYPNPVLDYLFVRTVKEENVSVKITTSAGSELFLRETTASPFNPAKIDMTQFPGGVYKINVTTNSSSFTNIIVKQ